MMKNRYGVLFIVALMAAIMLNAAIGYTNVSQNDYVSYGDSSVSKSTLKYAQRVISSYDTDDYPKAIDDLNKEYEKLSEYRTALNILSGNINYYDTISEERAREIAGDSKMSDSEAAEFQEKLKYCLSRLSYAIGYPEYISGIKNNASEMSGVSIFRNRVYKNIVRAENDFYGLENMQISAEPDMGVSILFGDRTTDIFGAAAALLCALFFTLRCRDAAMKSLPVGAKTAAYAALLIIGVAALYMTNMLMTDKFIGLGELSRSVQSIEEFRSCPHIISVGTLTALRIVFKLAACAVIYFVCLAVFSARKKYTGIIFAATAAALETALCLSGSGISITGLFRSENIIGRYKTVFMFGEALNSFWVFSLFCIAAFTVSGIAAFRSVRGMLLLARETAEKRYYDEINDKYNETRLIRHDIKNHLTALAMLMDDGKTDEARKYLSEISVEMDRARLPLQTGSAALDALLFKKLEDMKKNGIAVETEFTAGFSDTGISEYDLCGIFGNILDNAAEASAKLPPEKRRVRLSVKRQMDMICVYCENGYTVINDDLSTTKPDKSLHGLGLSRLRRIAERYSGNVDITAENGLFTLSLIMNTNKN